MNVCHAQAQRQTSVPEDRLRAAVQSYLQSPPLLNFERTSYMFAFVDLAGDGKRQAIVYLTDQGWCGSSGCHMMVLTLKGSSYKVVTMIPAVKLPIQVLESKSHGWRDLSVWIQGGGILRGYDEKVKFNGENYVKEGLEVDEEGPVRKLKGKIVLSYNDSEVPLYP
jgi:hypothetical protein